MQWCDDMVAVQAYEITTVVSAKGKTEHPSTLFPAETFMYLCGERGFGKPAHMFVSTACVPDSKVWIKHLQTAGYIQDPVQRYLNAQNITIEALLEELTPCCVGVWVPFV